MPIFSPTLFIGFSAGGFGGGSNLVRPIFGGFGGRTDFDVIAFWTLQNLGVGNAALIRGANANLQIKRFQQLEVLNMVREQIAEERMPGLPRSRPTNRPFNQDYSRSSKISIESWPGREMCYRSSSWTVFA